MFRWPLRKKKEKGEPSEKNPYLNTDSAWNTDAAWEEWGRRDPYFGVITDPKFRRSQITEQTKREFFESGRMHVDYVMQTIHRYINPSFVPKAVLDFGCGVGRTLIPFARIAEQVVGLDVSSAMLQEAKRNCDQQQLTNISLMPSDDSLSSLTQSFNLIHSFIVLQHVPPERGREIFRNLLAHLDSGGVGAVHFSHARKPYSVMDAPVTASHVAMPPTLPPDPEMQMNLYNMNELLVLMQEFRVQRFHAEFTDHGGEFGVFLFFSMGNSGLAAVF